MKYTQKELAYIWFDSFFAGDPFGRKLLEQAGSAYDFAENIEKFSDEMIKSGKECLYNKVRDSLSSNVYVKNLLKQLSTENIKAITLCSKNYPEELKNLSAPPLVLYAKGNLSLLQKTKFTIVGSRKTSAPVLKLTEQTAQTIAKHFVVVSGIADGGDRAALYGALPTGNVISVLPFGHGRISSTSASLYREVAEKGLVITEYPFSYQAQKYTFLIRNRILAALGVGTLAVSAGERSGVLNTCSHALDLGKDVFAFPYAPNVESGKGCNQLIKNGAFLCDDVQDILSCYGIQEIEQPSLDEEKDLLNILKENGELHIYELAEKTGREIDDLAAALLLLEMDGKVIKTIGNKYSAV